MKRIATSLLLLSATAHAQIAGDTVLVPPDSTASSEAAFRSLQNHIVGNSIVVDVPQSQSDLSVLQTRSGDVVTVRPTTMPNAIAAVPLSRSRIEAVEDEIDDTDAALSNTSFLGRLKSKYKDKDTPIFDISAYASTNDAASSVIAAGSSSKLDDNANLAAAIVRANSRGFAVKLQDLLLLKDKASTSQAVTAAFNAQYNTTLDSMAAAIEQPTEQNTQQFEKDAELTVEQFVSSWPQLRNNAAARSDAVRHLAGLMEQSPLKAIYALPSNFEPNSYNRIYEQSLRAVALYDRGERFCSGYMISSDWLMTAGHCLQRGDVQGMEVALQPSAGVELKAKLDDQWPLSGTGGSDTDPIDYVFLHIAPTPPFQAAWASVEQQAPLCLSKDEPDYEQPVFVIGYRPGDNLKVYDHAYVWFPFQALPKRFERISAMTGAKLQRLAEAWFKTPAEQNDFFDRNMTSFEKAYELHGTLREYRAERNPLAKRPYFGMDTDTFKGNSGAPVFARDRVCVVGVFSGGAQDGARPSEGTWKEHEFGIPLSEVIAHVRALDVTSDNPSDQRKASREALLAVLPQ